MFLLLPVAALTLVLIPSVVPGVGWDFRVFFEAGHHYLHGQTPYPVASLAGVVGKNVFVYPAPAAAATAPFALLPYWVAFGIWTAGSIAAVLFALRLVGVRDWRCFGAVFLTVPLLDSIRLGTVGPLLMLLLALLWRYRERRWIAAPALAALVVLKVFLWPLLIWLVFSPRHRRTALTAGALSVVVALVSWLPIGLSSVRAYPHVLGSLSRYEETFSFSPTSLAVMLGTNRTAAHVAVAVLGIGLLIAVALTASRAELLSFRLALAAAFTLSPIVWGHYWALLFVPLALTRPRLSPRWFVALWIPAEALFWTRWTAFWIAAALVVMLVQLDLVPGAPARLSGLSGYRFGGAMAAVAVAAFSVAAIEAGDSGVLRGAALQPISGGTAFAEARLSVDLQPRTICWTAWTEGVRSGGPARAQLTDGSGARLQLRGFALRGGGLARGCSNYAPEASARLEDIVDRSGSYRLEIKPGASDELLVGSLRGGSHDQATAEGAQ